MKKIHWRDDEEPALEAANLNQMQDNIESAIKDVDNKATGVINDVDIANIKNEIINVDDAMDYDAKLNPLGNLEQNRYTGKNKLGGYRVTNNRAAYIVILASNLGELKPDTTYTIVFNSAETGNQYYANEYLFTTSPRIVTQIGKNELTITTKSSIDKSSSGYWELLKNAKVQTNNISIEKPMVIEGTSSEDYEPYVGGIISPNNKYPQSINTVTKNNTIIKSNKNALTSYTVSNTKSAYLNIFEGKGLIQPGKTYTLSFTSNEAGNQYYVNEHLFTTLPRIVTRIGRNEISATTRDVIDISDPSVYNSARGYTFLKNAKAQKNNISIINPMLEIGEKASNYVKHLEDTYTFNLKKLELCKINSADTYQDYLVIKDSKLYKAKQVLKIVLTGNENFTMSQDQGLTRFALSNSEIKNESIRGIAISNYFNYTQTADAYVGLIFTLNGSIYMYPDSSISTVEQFKTWLSTHNTTIYVPIEETLEEITDSELIEQFNALDKFKTFEGSNTIYSTADLPPILDLTYYRSNKIRIQKLEQQVQKLLAAQITNNDNTQSYSNIPNELS